jgi:hypothetical protein
VRIQFFYEGLHSLSSVGGDGDCPAGASGRSGLDLWESNGTTTRFLVVS